MWRPRAMMKIMKMKQISLSRAQKIWIRRSGEMHIKSKSCSDQNDSKKLSLVNLCSSMQNQLAFLGMKEVHLKKQLTWQMFSLLSPRVRNRLNSVPKTVAAVQWFQITPRSIKSYVAIKSNSKSLVVRHGLLATRKPKLTACRHRTITSALGFLRERRTIHESSMTIVKLVRM